MLKMDKTEYKNGVKWIYRFKQAPKDAVQPQRLAPAFYRATYKCVRCGHVWNEASEGIPPLNEKPCILEWCSNPPLGFFVILFRQLRKEPIQGYGKLIKVEVGAWKF